MQNILEKNTPLKRSCDIRMLEEAKLRDFLFVALAYSNKGKTMNDKYLQPSQRKEVKRAVEPVPDLWCL